MRILITGATSGIGRQLAMDYHNGGHEVWAVGRNENSLQQLMDQGIHTLQVDLTNRTETVESFASLGAIDLAVLNAGTCEYVDLPEFDSALIARVMRANVESMAVSIEAVLPLLRRGERPHLAAVGSSAAYLPLTRSEAYGASKAAVEYMINSLRIDLYSEEIDVSLICPGFVKTPLTDRNDFPMPFRVTTEEASRYIQKGIEKRRMEIHFPKRFTYFLKLLSVLPTSLWTKIAQRMRKQ